MLELRRGQQVGCLGILFSSRRRVRVNGTLESVERGAGGLLQLRVRVQQAYNNCPKYIQVGPRAAQACRWGGWVAAIALAAQQAAQQPLQGAWGTPGRETTPPWQSAGMTGNPPWLPPAASSAWQYNNEWKPLGSGLPLCPPCPAAEAHSRERPGKAGRSGGRRRAVVAPPPAACTSQQCGARCPRHRRAGPRAAGAGGGRRHLLHSIQLQPARWRQQHARRWHPARSAGGVRARCLPQGRSPRLCAGKRYQNGLFEPGV